MSHTSSRPLTLDDIADRLGLSRGRISQLRKNPDFPSPLRRTLRRTEWNPDEIQDWATSNGYPYRSDDSKAQVAQYWKNSAPGHFQQTEVYSLFDASVLIYQEEHTRVAVLYGRSDLTPSQLKSITHQISPDWTVIVHSQLALHSPFVEVTENATGAAGEATLEEVARRLGVDLPYFDYSPAEESLILASRADTVLRSTPRSRIVDLVPAYRIFASSDDPDIRAAAGAFIESAQRSMTDEILPALLAEDDNPAREVIHMGVDAGTAIFHDLRGHATAGLEKLLYSSPEDDDAIRLMTNMERFSPSSAEPFVQQIIVHKSPVTARLIRNTWESTCPPTGASLPVTGHALLLNRLGDGPKKLPDLEFYANSAGELAIVYGSDVAMTRRFVEDRSPSRIMFVEKEGVMYIDDKGVAYAPTYHQGIGYQSGHRSAAVVVARELGIRSNPIENELANALDQAALELNVPLPATQVRSMIDPSTAS